MATPAYESLRNFLFSKAPKYLLEKRNQIIMVVFVSIFAVILINIFEPFESKLWVEKNGRTWYLVWTLILVIMGMSVIEEITEKVFPKTELAEYYNNFAYHPQYGVPYHYLWEYYGNGIAAVFAEGDCCITLQNE